jgi:peptidoglycan hydrolase-like protein with peptidoglycan-binding domain
MTALQRGSRGQTVADWQAFLSQRGMLNDVVDGVFGERTVQGTRRFQSSRRLTADGIVGPATVQAARALGFADSAGPPRPPAPPRVQLTPQPADDFYPAKPPFSMLSDAERRAIFGSFAYRESPNAQSDSIVITDGWDRANIVTVTLPGLAGKAVGGGRVSGGRASFHKKAAPQLVALWQAWVSTGLIDQVLTFDGSYNPRFQRGNHTRLSNHAYGTAFDINAQWNGFKRPAARTGQKGCLLPLVALALQHGFYWGGHFSPSTDGMHFEVAKLL